MTATKQITHIDGKEIISREPAMIPHPHPKFEGKLVETSGVEHILLEDGTETYMCVECGYVSENGRAIPAHMAGKHSKTRGPSMYSDETLRTVIREVLRARAGRYKNFCEEAARVLNEKGLPTKHGDQWTAASVSRLYNTHGPRLAPGLRPRQSRVVIAGPPPMTKAAAAVRAAVDDVPQESEEKTHDDVVDTAELRGPALAVHNNRVRRIQRMLHDMANELEWFARQYDEIERKAKAYDKLKQTMAGL